MEDRLFENLGNRETNDSVRAVLGIITPRLSYYRREMPPKSLKIGTFFPEPAVGNVTSLACHTFPPLPRRPKKNKTFVSTFQLPSRCGHVTPPRERLALWLKPYARGDGLLSTFGPAYYGY